VDDGSTDGTREEVLRYSDPRVRLVVHEANQGVCPARNTGVDSSCGEWIIFLDSDDELLPGALRVINDRTRDVGPEIHRLAFMCRLDTGKASIEPPLRDEIWDYEKYIRWAEALIGPGDFLNVVRRSAFDKVRYPEGRAFETLFHLDFARDFLTRTCTDIVATIHSDACNRSMDQSVKRLVAEALSNAVAFGLLLSRHGEALQRWGPSMHFKYTRGAATANFLAGRRTEGLWFAARCLVKRPFSLKVAAVVAFGLLGPRPLAWLKSRMY
jgi:glycosyltransferase involved in cell wall biosynthesis